MLRSEDLYLETAVLEGVYALLLERPDPELADFVLELFGMDDEIYDKYLGDFVAECLPTLAYQFWKDKTDVIRDFTLDIDNPEYNRWWMVEAIPMIYRYHPERKAEMVNLLQEMLQSLLNNPVHQDDGLINAVLTGMASETGAAGMEPLIRAVYEKLEVEEDIFGSLVELLEILNGEVPDYLRSEFVSGYDLIAQFKKHQDWDFPEDDDDDPFEYQVQEPAYNPYKSIGRNDPCPCGSGKKFKKCHWLEFSQDEN